MFSEPVVYVDIETTGGSPRGSKIIEVGAIRVEDDVVVEEYKSFVNPGRPLPNFITGITGINDSDLIQAPYFEEVAYQLHSLFEGAMFVAHNVRFDYSFLRKQLEESGYTWKPKLLCTVRLSRALYPNAVGHSLEKIIRRHNIAVSARHRALDDAKAMKSFVEIAYQETGGQRFKDAVARQLKSQSLPANLDEKSIESIPNSPGVYIFEGEKGNALYVGKSIKLRSRVLSHFNQSKEVDKELTMSQATHKLKIIKTASELEALLLESRLVKDLLPIHNRQLRSTTTHSVIVKDVNEFGYATISISEINLANCEELDQIYGVYTTRSKAKTALIEKQKTFGLCSKLIGLEKAKGACFLYQLGKCSGACIGLEDQNQYNNRLELALNRTKLESWPFKSAVAICEDNANAIVIDKWLVLGYIRNSSGASGRFEPVERRFDIDTYRIIRSYLKTHRDNLRVVPVSPQSALEFELGHVI